jgi:hypothetical protein
MDRLNRSAKAEYWHTSVTEQFSQALEEKDHKISLLESKIRRLLSTVRGSR